MTNTEYRLKFPIGTKIIYVPNTNVVCAAACKDADKQGIVIEHIGCQVKIHLPMSLKQSKTWRTLWENIKLLPQKNQQLLFDFALEGI